VSAGGDVGAAGAVSTADLADVGTKMQFLTATDIARKSLEIASGICIYTNDSIVVEEI
jgi:ATP-dependent HslUV protease subunit HslV